MNQNGTWDLSVIYAGYDDPRYAADRRSLEEGMDRLQALLDGKPGPDALHEVTAVLEEILSLSSQLSSVTMLTLATDARNAAALAERGRIMKTRVRLETLESAVTAYVGAIADLEERVAADPFLSARAYALRRMRESCAHLIDPALEPTVLKLSMSGAQAWSQLRSQLDAGHMVEVDLPDGKKTMPLSAARGLAYSPDAAVRKAAYEGEIASYPRMETAMAACLNGVKGESITMAELRRFDSPLDAALDISRIDREVLDALLTAMRESLPAFRRYLRLKARALGHEGGLPFWDLFAPLGGSARQYSAEEARAMLIDVLGRFSDAMADHIADMFDHDRIDLYPREGKGGGAFCAGVHRLGLSFVCTNFDGSLGSVSTLAHELGHAYHGRCLRGAPLLAATYPMPLAETASIFNETLFTDELKHRAEGDEKLAIIDQELTDAAQVIVDILSRFLFEKEVMDRRADGPLTPAQLCGIMLDAQKQTYGDGLDEKAMHPYMWACKSHYYSPRLDFYNFPYAFGLLFGKGIFAIYQKMGGEFLPLYDELLRRTGSGSVREVAASVGIDVADVAFWRESLRVVLEGVDEMAALVR